MNAQNSLKDKHIEVALRMLGHKILQSVSDSTSRVLPVIKENNQYRIQFESDFAFTSEGLVAMVKDIVDDTEIANNYIVEVEHCNTSEIIYSFEVNETSKLDIIPCGGRIQPKSCYNILFTIIDEELSGAEFITLLNSDSNPQEFGNGFYAIILALVIIILIIFFYKRKQSLKKKFNSNLISLGAYHFDKNNTELIIDNQKIELTSKEAELLHLLYKSVNDTVERDVILNMVWGDDGDYIGRTVDVFISKLRKKLEFDSKLKIVNVRGIGYKLVINT
ncbi:winged helix-turn-helix domain-containing protein [Algibacter luteus]|uniref:winged helix-turn-helix domain-containing protein n=1 Tax=Algibacter luteus TaxID=1178825 RepID=UPI0004B2B181|nr:response regulator transcription factor [Algibacter luteus]